ncbi:MAG: glycoside hydrolase [Clostridiales bacterium]|nr:glycoside hydrolase [Clostridiales bacterium]
MKEYRYGSFALSLSDPAVVHQGPEYSKVGWGPEQFPYLAFTDKGDVTITWSTGADDIEAYENSFSCGRMVSRDGGETWEVPAESDRAVGVPMANGREYFRPEPKNAYRAPWIDKYQPAYRVTDGSYRPSIFRAEGISEFKNTYTSSEYDPAAGLKTCFESKVNWPHLAVTCFYLDTKKLVYPIECTMGIMGRFLPAEDGSMLFCTYGHGFSAEDGSLPSPGHYNVYVFRSDDCGRTWDYMSQLLTPPDIDSLDGECEGFCEPMMTKAPDGSYVILMRTGSSRPCYIARSTDGCRSWSEPVKFDRYGVLPNIVTLGCGITLASYGRPGVYLRAASDPSAAKWEEPAVILGEGVNSCCYTSILPLSDTEALLAYSDFTVPDRDGVERKSIMTLRVKVS